MPKLWTPEEYDALPDDGVRRDLIEGVLWVPPSPDESHQTLAARLMVSLDVRLDVPAPVEFSLPELLV